MTQIDYSQFTTRNTRKRDKIHRICYITFGILAVVAYYAIICVVFS
jgi:uncharacterized membrane protein